MHFPLSLFAFFLRYGDIYPRSTVARLVTVIQMMVATLFTVVIFGLGMRYLGTVFVRTCGMS